MTRSSQVMVDRRINPNFATNTEVFADTWEGKTAVVLPAGLTVNVGDVIEFDQGRVDPSDPCQYIPNLAVSKHQVRHVRHHWKSVSAGFMSAPGRRSDLARVGPVFRV